MRVEEGCCKCVSTLWRNILYAGDLAVSSITECFQRCLTSVPVYSGEVEEAKNELLKHKIALDPYFDESAIKIRWIVLRFMLQGKEDIIKSGTLEKIAVEHMKIAARSWISEGIASGQRDLERRVKSHTPEMIGYASEVLETKFPLSIQKVCEKSFISEILKKIFRENDTIINALFVKMRKNMGRPLSRACREYNPYFHKLAGQTKHVIDEVLGGASARINEEIAASIRARRQYGIE